MATETYPLTSFTASNGAVDTEALEVEVNSAPAVVALCLGATKQGTDVVLDFDAVLDAPQQSALGAVVAAHPAQALPEPTPVVRLEGEATHRADGVLRVQLEPSTKNSKVKVKGLHWLADLVPVLGTSPEESHQDLTFGTFGDPPIDFQGLQGLWVEHHQDDDFMELLAMFPKTGTQAQWVALGLGPWPFGAADTPEQAGQPDVTLFKFGESVYLPPDGKVPPIIAEGTFTLAAPLFLRFCYFAHGEDGTDTKPHVVVLVLLWEGL